MSPRHWAHSLAQAAYERGWLTLSAQKKALLLVEVGLHPEQAFIGTALLSAEQYAALVEQLWQVRLQRLDVDMYTICGRTGNDACCIEAENEAGEPVIVRMDAWTQPSQKINGPQVVDTFRSDVLRWIRQPGVVDLSVSEWLEAWSTVDATELRLGVEEGRGVVQAGIGQAPVDDGCIKVEEIPALQTWFEVGYGSRFWDANRELGLESDWLELVAKHERHPLTKTHGWQEFLRNPKGVLYVAEPDAWLRRQLELLKPIPSHEGLFQKEQVYRYHPQTIDERELALHGALAGAAVCWVDDSGESMACMRRIAQAGIPVTVVRSRPTLHGAAWEVYSIVI